MEVQKAGHLWGIPSRLSAASVETDAPLAVGLQTQAGTLEELDTWDKKK